MKDYCEQCNRLHETLMAADNRREFLSQLVRDVGSPKMLELYLEADTAAKMARAAVVLHEQAHAEAVKV